MAKNKSRIESDLIDTSIVDGVNERLNLAPAPKKKYARRKQLDKYEVWEKFLENAEKCGMDPVQWGEFLEYLADSGVSLKGANDGRSIARRVTPFMVLEMARLAIQAKSDSVRQTALKEVAYIGGAKPADRIEFEDVSKMSIAELDNVILESFHEILSDDKRTRLGRLTADRYIEGEITDAAGGGEAQHGGTDVAAPESSSGEEDRLLPPPQGPTGFSQGSEEDALSGGGQSERQDDSGCSGGGMVCIRDASIPKS